MSYFYLCTKYTHIFLVTGTIGIISLVPSLLNLGDMEFLILTTFLIRRWTLFVISCHVGIFISMLHCHCIHYINQSINCVLFFDVTIISTIRSICIYYVTRFRVNKCGRTKCFESEK